MSAAPPSRGGSHAAPTGSISNNTFDGITDKAFFTQNPFVGGGLVNAENNWWGHCNGWAAAAALEREPFYPIEADGITFEVADLKGLLTESYYSQVSDFSGSRYYKPKEEHTEAYERGKELLKAISKESVSMPTSRWVTILVLCS